MYLGITDVLQYGRTINDHMEVRGGEKVREVPTLLTEEEFRKKLEDYREALKKIRRDPEYRTMYLAGQVCAETEPIYTSDQLKRLFDLTYEE